MTDARQPSTRRRTPPNTAGADEHGAHAPAVDAHPPSHDRTGRVVVAGASGFVGAALARAFADDGREVVRIGRDAQVPWSDARGVRAAVDGADILVNLAGKSVNCRYTDANREELLRSRTETTRQLHEAVVAAANPPRVWLNASTATIYRHAMHTPQTESSGEIGTGFSVDIAREWERVCFAGETPGTRRVALRMAIVLGDGPATRMLFTLARLGLGGPQLDGWFPQHDRYRGIGAQPSGDGSAPHHRTRGLQRFSWIHLDDVIGAVRLLADRDDIEGPVNLSTPNPANNRVLMALLRRAVRAPFGLPAWRWMLEPAMAVLRTEPELVLKSRYVLPERLEAAGYAFRWPTLGPAIAHTWREIRRRGR